METTRKLRKPGLEHFVAFVRDLPELSPLQLFELLEERGYRGQVGARRALCLMAYRHVRRIKRIFLEGVSRNDVPKKTNTLLIGPTGCGKTFLIELLFDNILRLPTALVDITAYSETGYVGQDPCTILTRLLHAADEDPLLASIGIICLDEFDKISSGQNNAVFSGAGTTKDVTGMGVQRELLKMLESSDVVVPLEVSQSTYGDHAILSTADISFVAAGAFSGFQQLTQRSADRIGFQRKQRSRGNVSREAIAVDLTPEEVENIANFHRYGFLPELMARFTRVIPFAPLDRSTLVDILRTDVVARMEAEFASEGVELVVDGEVFDRVVDDAINHETGARGLSATLTRVLENAAFTAFGTTRGGRATIRVEEGQLAVRIDLGEGAPSGLVT